MSAHTVESAQVVLPCGEPISATIEFFTGIGFKVRTIVPADHPRMAVLEGHGLTVRLEVGTEAPPAHLRLLVSAGYNVGATAIEIRPDYAVTHLWSTRKIKAKFSNPALLGDMIFGLDDGILSAIESAEGHGLWKEGRYGHGQGLLVGNLYVLMAENGEICLLQPTRKGPGELARRRIFDAKTWNPIALAGDLLLVRNDREAACLRLPLARPIP